MKKFLMILSVSAVLFSFVACDDSKPVEPIGLGISNIENLASYRTVGAGSETMRSRDGEYISFLIGDTGSSIEKVRYLDNENKPIEEPVYLTAMMELGDFIFVALNYKDLPFNEDSSMGEYNFCIHMPSKKFYMLPFDDFVRFYNPGEYAVSADGEKVVFRLDSTGSVYQIYERAGNLQVDEIIGGNVSGFDSFRLDRYGNIFSYSGSIYTSEGYLGYIDSGNKCVLGLNGVMYYTNGDTKGYYDKCGKPQSLTPGGFFPDKTYDSLGAENLTDYDSYSYEEGLTKYLLLVSKTYGNNTTYKIPEIIHKITYTPDGVEYNYEAISVSGIDNVNSAITLLEGEKEIYALTRNAFYKIDLTTGNGSILLADQGYYEYLDAWDIGPYGFEIEALDKTQKTASVRINRKGMVMSSEVTGSSQFDHFTLHPIN